MRVLFQTGGYTGHPVAEQAERVSDWLGDRAVCVAVEGNQAFEQLDECDLFVPMGTIWQGLPEGYTPLDEAQKQGLREFCASGKPLLIHHGAVACYNDWDEIQPLYGIQWVRDESTHSPFDTYPVEVRATGHPVIAGVDDFSIADEIYYNLTIRPEGNWQTHATADWLDEPRPMVLTSNGGRVPGAGRAVYLALGHDLRSFGCPALRRLWLNSFAWLTGE